MLQQLQCLQYSDMELYPTRIVSKGKTDLSDPRTMSWREHPTPVISFVRVNPRFKVSTKELHFSFKHLPSSPSAIMHVGPPFRKNYLSKRSMRPCKLIWVRRILLLFRIYRLYTPELRSIVGPHEIQDTFPANSSLISRTCLDSLLDLLHRTKVYFVGRRCNYPSNTISKAYK